MKKIVVFIESECFVKYYNNHIKIKKENKETEICLENIGCVIFDNHATSVSLIIIEKLIEKNISVIFCNNKKYPYAIAMPLYGSCDTSIKIRKQLGWDTGRFPYIWKKIIENKISSQIQLLEYYRCKIEKPEVIEDDINNVEGRFAKLYFSFLFGNSFRRHLSDDINISLNYGYIILLTLTCRIICGHGYLTQLGIHHKGAYNNYNLACDIMEPFRPIIDSVVYENKDKPFDNDMKKLLARIGDYPIRYNGEKYNLYDALEKYVLEIIESIETGNNITANIEIQWGK